MSAEPGWYDAGVPGRQRWWDGSQWTATERPVLEESGLGHPPVGHPMGWYSVPGTTDVRWWDGSAWTPYRVRGGKPLPDAFAVEPVSVGFVLGFVFLAVALSQLSLALAGGDAVFSLSPLLFLGVAAVWFVGAITGSRVRKGASPQSAPLPEPAGGPLPGQVEGEGAGWYPMTGQVARWWTGTRWSWYIGQKFGVRPGHAGPRGYRVSMILGWIMAGLGVLAVLGGFLLYWLLGPGLSAGTVSVAIVVGGIILAALGALVLVLTRVRRDAMVPPEAPPSMR